MLLLDIISHIQVKRSFYTSIVQIIQAQHSEAQLSARTTRPSRFRLRYAPQEKKLLGGCEYESATSSFQSWVVQHRFNNKRVVPFAPFLPFVTNVPNLKVTNEWIPT